MELVVGDAGCCVWLSGLCSLRGRECARVEVIGGEGGGE